MRDRLELKISANDKDIIKKEAQNSLGGLIVRPLSILKEVNYTKNFKIKFPKDMPARISIIVNRGVC
tara:strand:+ start:936 stop:1136 length:201 start_codon:yes stop_codon:yes gene_type:complete